MYGVIILFKKGLGLMSKKQVDVDILSANYNNGKYLKRFIESIIDSSVWPNQLIIVDDASNDDSLDIIGSFDTSELNIKLIRLNKNVGFANALNEGVSYINSKYVLRIDPDDIIHPVRIEKQYNFLEKNSLIDLVGSDVVYFADSESNITGQSSFPIDHLKIVKCYKDGHHGVCHGSVLFKSICLFDERYKQENVPAEEYDIFSRLIIKNYTFANISEGLTFVRIHSSSVSNNMPYSTVEKTFRLRADLWGYKSNKLYVFKEFIARNAYRKYISSRNITRYIQLLLAVSMKPISALKRLFKNEK
jgi:glycosyltransferase involved in cell wall biosynthesis